MIKKIAGLIAIAALSGCAVTYTYDGQKYDSKEKFQQAVDAKSSAAVSTITPLSTPLVRRKLVFAIPSETALFNETVGRHAKMTGSSPNTLQNEMYENICKSNHKGIKVYFDAIKKRNIFASTQFIEMQAMTGSFAASADADTLYFEESSQDSPQWYYSSLKHGKQVFACDKNSPTIEGRVQAFVDAVQAQAIRD